MTVRFPLALIHSRLVRKAQVSAPMLLAARSHCSIVVFSGREARLFAAQPGVAGVGCRER